MLQASGSYLVCCFVVVFKYRYQHKNNAMLKRTVNITLPHHEWQGTHKKIKVLWLHGVVTAGTQLPDVSIKVLIGQNSERNFFLVWPFCQEVERKILFILVVTWLPVKSHHSEMLSFTLEPELPRGLSAALWEAVGGSGVFSRVSYYPLCVSCWLNSSASYRSQPASRTEDVFYVGACQSGGAIWKRCFACLTILPLVSA